MIILLSVLIIALAYYLFLPAINPTTVSFWVFVIFSIVVVWFISSFSRLFNFNLTRLKKLSKATCISFASIAVIIFGTIIINIFVSPLFNDKSYAKRIEVVDGVFKDDIEEVDFTKVPLLDKASSEKVGDRIMGQYAEYVSYPVGSRFGKGIYSIFPYIPTTRRQPMEFPPSIT